MNAILDVCYRDRTAITACVEFQAWTDARPNAVHISQLDHIKEYVPGRFFERELPCLLNALALVEKRFEIVVIDGFVHLKPPRIKGLGARLADSLPHPCAVIGVAKSQFELADRFVPLLRGRSRRPLYVSAVGVPLQQAADLVRNMSGAHRVPALIKIADRASRAGRGD